MSRRIPALDPEALSAEITSLSKVDIDKLRDRWKAIYGKTPSREIGRSFLIRAIAYRLQERVFGGLKPSAEQSTSFAFSVENRKYLAYPRLLFDLRAP